MNYYTIFLGEKMFEDVIDDMNRMEIWGEGGMVWDSKEKAFACVENLKRYGVEDDENKLSVVEFVINKREISI